MESHLHIPAWRNKLCISWWIVMLHKYTKAQLSKQNKTIASNLHKGSDFC